MGATPLTPEQRVEQTTLAFQSVAKLIELDDIVHLREALLKLDQCSTLQEDQCTQFIDLFQSLNTQVNKHQQHLSSNDMKRWTRFALLGKNIAPVLAEHLIAVEDWGLNLPALAHLMIITLFKADEHADVQRDLLVAHAKRGYQTFFLCCDMHWCDGARYNRLIDQCEAMAGVNDKLTWFRLGPKSKP
jgi:hypothetical protein